MLNVECSCNLHIDICKMPKMGKYESRWIPDYLNTLPFLQQIVFKKLIFTILYSIGIANCKESLVLVHKTFKLRPYNSFF